jgi:hypothetical protein
VWITPRHPVQLDLDRRWLRALNVPVPGRAEPVGILSRSGAPLSELAGQLMDALRELALPVLSMIGHPVDTTLVDDGHSGSGSVVSCASFAPMSARSVPLETLPIWVRGSASMSSRRSGHLYLARPAASR